MKVTVLKKARTMTVSCFFFLYPPTIIILSLILILQYPSRVTGQSMEYWCSKITISMDNFHLRPFQKGWPLAYVAISTYQVSHTSKKHCNPWCNSYTCCYVTKFTHCFAISNHSCKYDPGDYHRKCNLGKTLNLPYRAPSDRNDVAEFRYSLVFEYEDFLEDKHVEFRACPLVSVFFCVSIIHTFSWVPPGWDL